MDVSDKQATLQVGAEPAKSCEPCRSVIPSGFTHEMAHGASREIESLQCGLRRAEEENRV